MSNKMKMALVLILILLVGGYFVVSGDDEMATPTENNESSVMNDENSNTDNPLGINIASLTGAYKVTVVTKDADGKTTTAEVLADGSGNTQINTMSGEMSYSIISIDGDTYSQDPSSGLWLKFPSSTNMGDSPSAESYGFSDKDIEDLRNDTSLESLGKQSCSSGTCRVYKNTGTNGDVTLVKVDDKTNRITEVMSTSADGSTTAITYQYDSNIKITAPEKFSEFSVPNLGQ
jgi:hypothetical protein